MELFTTDQIYNICLKMNEFIKCRHTSNKIVKLFESESFEYIARNRMYKTPNWEKGVIKYITLANNINSGVINFNVFCCVYLCEGLLQDKPLTQNLLNHIDKLQEIFKFYTILETKKQLDIINNMIDEQREENPFEVLLEPNLDVYKVNESQKNQLYEFVESKKINTFVYMVLYFKNKFQIDESKIDDLKFKKFIKLLQIIRQNKTK